MLRYYGTLLALIMFALFSSVNADVHAFSLSDNYDKLYYIDKPEKYNPSDLLAQVGKCERDTEYNARSAQNAKRSEYETIEEFNNRKRALASTNQNCNRFLTKESLVLKLPVKLKYDANTQTFNFPLFKDVYDDRRYSWSRDEWYTNRTELYIPGCNVNSLPDRLPSDYESLPRGYTTCVVYAKINRFDLTYFTNGGNVVLNVKANYYVDSGTPSFMRRNPYYQNTYVNIELKNLGSPISQARALKAIEEDLEWHILMESSFDNRKPSYRLLGFSLINKSLGKTLLSYTMQ